MLVRLLALAAADCPDRDVRCRIPNVETVTNEKVSGCEGGANAGWSGSDPAGSVSINGRCFMTYKNTDGTRFAPVGSFTAGTCYQYQFGDLSVSDSCRPCSSLIDQCSEKVPGCRLCESVCTKEYTVRAGDNCWAIANSNGMTLGALQAMNPSLNCSPLQPNDKVCLATGDGACKNVCEGAFV